MSHFWSGYIILLVAANIIGCFVLLWATGKYKKDEDGKADTGHVWDDDLTELNTPLPRWWLGLFYITLFFGIGYLLLYPGLGNFSGLLHWSQAKSYQAQQVEEKKSYATFIDKHAKQPIPDLIHDAEAMKTAQRLFQNNCSTCHGSDAKGAPGFPNLTDNDWLYGSAPEKIKESIMHGRHGVMPSFKTLLKDKDHENLIAYLRQLNGEYSDPDKVREGQTLFATTCAACHGPDAKGNQTVGAPNLTDNIWLYGGSDETIKKTLMDGRNGKMPAHEKLLDPATIHLLAAYVYSLSH